MEWLGVAQAAVGCASAGARPCWNTEVAMRKHLSTVVAGVLVVVATLLVFIPESRTLPMRMMLGVLWVIVAGSTFWRLHRAGVLRMTPGQLHQMVAKPKFSLLHSAALMIGAVAIIATAT